MHCCRSVRAHTPSPSVLCDVYPRMLEHGSHRLTPPSRRVDFVRRRLEANRLEGPGLVELAEGLPYLTDLSLADNSLEGAIGPIGAEGREWQRLDLRFNALDYGSNDENTKELVRCRTCPDLSARAAGSLPSLHAPPPPRQVELCLQRDNKCAGLPPHACSAFGGNTGEYVLSISDPLHCEKCEGLLLPILLISGVSAILLLGLGTFIALVVKFPGALRRSVSSATIFINHTQTVAILASLRLEWPRSVQVLGRPAELSGALPPQRRS